MKKKAIVCGVLYLLIIFLSSCSTYHNTSISPKISPTSTKSTSSLSSLTTYTVTRETWFYKNLHSDETIRKLTTGVKVKPAYNKKYLDCETIVVEGIKITLCNMELISSREVGWILKNALKFGSN